MSKKNLGKKARDVISGFTGVITGVATYITGCDQYSILGDSKDGEFGNTVWLDVNRVDVDHSASQVVIETEKEQGACSAPTKY